MEDTQEINVDLLIVTDYSDTLTLYALHIICALQSVFKNYTVESRKIYDVNESFICKKVLFITWGFTKYTKTKVTKWLNELKIENKRRFIINVTGDSYGIPLETLDVNDSEFCDQNKLNVQQIKHVENWWPHTLQFLLDLSRPKKSIFKYHLRQSESIFKETVCSCLDYFNIERSDKELDELEGCNISLVKAFPRDVEERNTVYLSDNFEANPITQNQYKWDKVILFITRIYVITGVIKKEIKKIDISYWDRIKVRRLMLIERIERIEWIKFGPFLEKIGESLFCPVCFIMFGVSFALPIGATVLTYLILDFSEWFALIILCIIHSTFVLASTFLFVFSKYYCKKVKLLRPAGLCHLIAGFTNIIIVIVILAGTEFYKAPVGTSDMDYDDPVYIKMNRSFASFILFCVDLGCHAMWIPQILWCPNYWRD